LWYSNINKLAVVNHSGGNVEGIRHLIVVILNEEIKVAQYGQWDGHLEGQGKIVMDFISKKMDFLKFKKTISECKFLTPDEVNKTWTECA
jgi:hypothetical protein